MSLSDNNILKIETNGMMWDKLNEICRIPGHHNASSTREYLQSGNLTRMKAEPNGGKQDCVFINKHGIK